MKLFCRTRLWQFKLMGREGSVKVSLFTAVLLCRRLMLQQSFIFSLSQFISSEICAVEFSEIQHLKLKTRAAGYGTILADDCNMIPISWNFHFPFKNDVTCVWVCTRQLSLELKGKVSLEMSSLAFAFDLIFQFISEMNERTELAVITHFDDLSYIHLSVSLLLNVGDDELEPVGRLTKRFLYWSNDMKSFFSSLAPMTTRLNVIYWSCFQAFVEPAGWKQPARSNLTLQLTKLNTSTTLLTLQCLHGCCLPALCGAVTSRADWMDGSMRHLSWLGRFFTLTF